jgi:hypothetical protein
MSLPLLSQRFFQRLVRRIQSATQCRFKTILNFFLRLAFIRPLAKAEQSFQEQNMALPREARQSNEFNAL